MSAFRRGVVQANSSLISMLQRFIDIFMMFFGLYIICILSNKSFDTQYLLVVLANLVVFQMIGGMTDFYRSWRGVRGFLEIKATLINWTMSLLVTSFAFTFTDYVSNDSKIYVKWYLTVAFGLIAGRYLIRKILGVLRKLGYNTRNVVIVGSLPVGIRLAESLSEAHWMGFNVLGIYNDEPVNSQTVPFKGDIEQLIRDAKKGGIDRIYIAMPMEQELEIKEIIVTLTDTTCSVMLIPDLFTFDLLQSRTEEINGVSVIPLFDSPMSGVNAIIKQIEDFTLALFIILFISPILLIIACLIKLTSPGPVIFKQKRYGIDGKAIDVWKFRSMSVMENGEQVVQATKGDSRITSLGAFLRRTSLDELPQFFNVLKGDMSIVGPRPHAIAHNEQYRKLIRGYMLRHKMKPGITGWAQINGWRGETDTLDKMEKRVEFDLEYIRNWSVWFDLRIIFLTVFKGFVHKAAY
ncbi:undecaprenyl-phosphate glucose phosphotransferase [Serratia quinivorans]|uniref:undecaprenyl-phosphate glucose phosphotransferase n=1 Tax=Serratia quinivorans TaxID=137545 RepID=UPI002179ACA6|nr:undecaprenyl-phosphate glucose phosphotransferase [Serratia quinivorans]CAI0905813.1 Putative colanic biosynthesis UDP-glucose lipid carrier transferase [Serratia quinivorans]CAI0932374.1 Putative colanic biosynthesis UDP-glucose lipid carrier transferase [Serratia quinivorans]CAI1524393.1 Putative colanic biosynthesis UDP-glucose lipid carrier transferase [Serratia quinivorans]CAI2060707.1 Putative colanic biosynthesis UDP-glucose lipid carrier transferase [Serratia quinivorans]CAI2094566.